MLNNICHKCKNKGGFHKSKKEGFVGVGGSDLYEPICRKCYNNSSPL